jgi:hypothetical protein
MAVKTRPIPWTVVEKSRNVHEFRAANVKSGWEGWVLWMSDEHWDNPKCRWDLLKAHHDEAKERGALIVKVGDTFCAMQGKGDPRGDKESIRPIHQAGNYLDKLVSTAADWYLPWKQNIAVIGLGNHETSVYKHHETCLIERLCERLRDRGGITRKGGYSGFVRCLFKANGTKGFSYTAYYNHGFGGGGPVTKGLIDFSRMSEWVLADAMVSGHVHWKNSTPAPRMSLDPQSRIVVGEVQFVRCGTYKDEFEDGHASWHVEKGRGPRPLGGYWQRSYFKNDQIHTEWIEAKA